MTSRPENRPDFRTGCRIRMSCGACYERPASVFAGRGAVCVSINTLTCSPKWPACCVVSFWDVDEFLALAAEMLREVVHEPPVEVFVHVSEAVTLVRKHEHVESLAGLDQRIDHACSVAWMNIIIDISMHKEKMTL